MNKARHRIYAILLFVVGCVVTQWTSASPIGILSAEAGSVFEAASREWLEELIDPHNQNVSDMDEQIFTEISPLIESPDAVRLPDDPRGQDQPAHDS